MKAILRSLLAVFLGVFTGFVVVFVLEGISSLVLPLPTGLDSPDPKIQLAAIAQLPASAFAMLLLAWTSGTFSGSWVAVRIARRRPLVYAAIVGGFFLLAAIANMVMMPHPPWFQALSVILVPACAWLGAKPAQGLAGRSKPVLEGSPVE